MLMGMMIVVGFIVGFLVGCTGMGGIILIPALVYLSGLSSHVAMGTTLFTFIFTTSLCSWLYIRLGHVDWKATIPICIGGFLFTYVGADVKAFTAAPYLNLILALLILLAGALVFCPVRGGVFLYGRGAAVALLGAVRRWQRRGFVAGLTGAGGLCSPCRS
ncbi:MAG: TSUP family transporter [Bilophila wadsworthia]